MTNPMPAYAAYHFSTFMGYVPAVSLAQAKTRAKAMWPGKKLQIEMALNVKPTAKDRLTANLTYNAKRA